MIILMTCLPHRKELTKKCYVDYMKNDLKINEQEIKLNEIEKKKNEILLLYEK